MPNGLTYPTGVSAQPIDVTSGARAFMRSAIESRLDEIAASKEQISENQKNVLKAMSIRALPELANAQRDRYQKEIEDYRQEAINKFKESGGKLTLQQQREIQDGFVDMQQRMQQDVNQLKIYEKYQAVTEDPNFRFGYDTEKAMQSLANAYKSVMEGKGVGDLATQFAQAQIPPSLGDYVEKQYGTEIERMDIKAKGEWIDDATFKFTQQEDEDEVYRTIDDIINTDPNIQRQAQQIGYDRMFDKLKDLFIKKEEKITPRRRDTGIGDRYKYATDYDLQETQYGGKTYDIVGTPGDVATPEKALIIGEDSGAVNLETGQPIIGRQEVRIMGVGYDKGTGDPVILAQGEGGYLAKDGEVALEAVDSQGRLGRMSATKTEKQNLAASATIQDLRNKDKMKEQAQTTLINKTKNDKLIVRDITLQEPEDERDFVVVRGSVNYSTKDSKRERYQKQEDFEYRFKKRRDPRADVVFELPYERHKPKLAAWRRKALIEGKDVMGLAKRKGLAPSPKPTPTPPRKDKPKVVRQNGVTYYLNEQTGEYEAR